MKNLINAYLTNKKVTIPVTILVAVLLVGGIAWGVSATEKDEPTVTASKEVSKITDKNGATKSTDKKDNKAASVQNDKSSSEDKTTSDKKNDTKASATGKVTDTKKEDKKDTSKKNTSNKNEGSNSSSSNNSANNNQQTPTEPETPAETYDSYNRPMSCSSTFFNTYAGLPAWKENGNVCYYRNGVKVVKSQGDYDKDVLYYNDGWRDCPSCGAEVSFGYISTDCNPSSETYGMDGYGCDVCRYIESRPHVCRGYCLTDGCCLTTEW